VLSLIQVCDILPRLKHGGFPSSRKGVSCFTESRLTSFCPNGSSTPSTGIDGEPLRKNINRGIGATIVSCPALRTHPFTYVQG
jgi:hypothetical protein